MNTVHYTPKINGLAGWYGEECRGLLQANGKPFDPRAMTCATWDYPMGSWLRVTYGDRWITVQVTDRGPRRDIRARGVLLDLSRQAFGQLADINLGHIWVSTQQTPAPHA